MGPRQISLNKDMTYTDVMDVLKSTFFPNGRNFITKLDKVSCLIGNAKGEEIPRSSFPLENFLDQQIHAKPRLYLLTKLKVSLES
ncbi:hypothetical protein FSP39_012384 [Pinctada imbricata]|uniref:Uncharacterized protein n=1 Tax=Pinctada imbricata TaxID=66713 RepID=A0AA88YTX0_PINIB|nr:hypothetical protein FSP39_012384 [Pinctada imbricata]